MPATQTPAAKDFLAPFAHLGPAPYSFAGMQCAEDRLAVAQAAAEKQGVSLCGFLDGHKPKCGTSCDHCGTYIENVYTFRASDGVTFKVGETCANKILFGENSERRYDRSAAIAKRAMNKAKLERKHRTDAAKIEAASQWIGENREALDALPHPRGFDGLSFLDSLRWTRENAGVSGTLKAYRAAYVALGQKMPRLK